MQKDYTSMWEELGLNLENHAGLLGVLSDAYKNIYLSQKGRPKEMGYFDFVISEIHGLRVEEIYEAKKARRKVIGTFCLYVPEEIVLAVDGVCIGLCAGAEVGTDEAEKFIPRNTCAIIKAFMGFKLAGLCPYVELTDLLVGETTCDGKKKAYEIFNEVTKKVYVMEIPNMKSEILISGSPLAIPNWKLHAIVEGSGAIVVGEESCVGERNHRELLNENFATVDEGLEKIATRYLSIDCACFTPNNERIDNIKSMIENLHADGVIHYSLQFCTPYMMEAYKVEKAIKDVPFIRLETDYSMEDMGQLKTRVEAFLEMIK